MAAWPCRAYSPTTGSVRHAESADFNTCVLKESSAIYIEKIQIDLEKTENKGIMTMKDFINRISFIKSLTQLS